MREREKKGTNLTTSNLDVKDVDAGDGGPPLQAALHIVYITSIFLCDIRKRR